MITKNIVSSLLDFLAAFADAIAGRSRHVTCVTYSGLEYVEDFPEWDESLTMPSVSHYVRPVIDFNTALAANDNSRLRQVLTCWR